MSDMISGMTILVIGLTITAILVGSVLISGLGSLANGTKGTACTNCSATTKTLLPNIEIFIVIGVLLAVIGGAIAAFKGRGGK